MSDYDDFAESPEDFYEGRFKADDYFLDAQQDVKELYEKDKESIFYIRQLQVKFEKKYFHWVTNNAIIALYDVGYLRDIRIPKEKALQHGFLFTDQIGIQSGR